MPRFAANLSLLFTELPLPERFAAAAEAGFDAVEIQFPYDFPAPLLRTAADEAGVQIILINLPAGDLMAGGYGLASHPQRKDAFACALNQAEDYARTLGVRMVNVLAGRQDPAESTTASWETLATNLARCARQMSQRQIRTTCEAINTLDMPGFMVSTPAQLARLLDAAAHPAIDMQFDLYHMARMQIDIPQALKQWLPRIGHIQFADNPGRHEPGSGSLALQAYFELLDSLNYTGWCAAEYKPSRTTADTLEWLRIA